MSASPRPWKRGDSYEGDSECPPLAEIADAKGTPVMEIADWTVYRVGIKEMLRIVNSHDKLVDFAKAHEAWEAKIIMDGYPSGLIEYMSPELYEEARRLQDMRNAALKEAGAE